jgi:CHRD domain
VRITTKMRAFDIDGRICKREVKMRRVLATLVLSTALIPALGGTASAVQLRSEPLAGGNENPPVISEGSGSFRVQTRNGDFRLRYDIPGEVTAAHIHIGNPGTNGGIVVFLCPTTEVPECPPSPGEVTGTIVEGDVLAVPPTIDAGNLDGLALLGRQGALYVNIHTTAHTSGELRGQIKPRKR